MWTLVASRQRLTVKIRLAATLPLLLKVEADAPHVKSCCGTCPSPNVHFHTSIIK